MDGTTLDPTPPLAAFAPRDGGGPRELQPGHLSKPEKVWASSSTLILGFYQAAPYSEMFKIFYKKSGSVFGTQVSIPPQSILGPELAVRQPMLGEVMYFEYEIKKLKPSTQYIVKIKTGDDAPEVKSEKMGTISLEEERTRNNDMHNFKGALVKLGEYDGLVAAYVPDSGIFAIRILQMDDLSQATQLARLASEYSDNGLPVQAYTLSQIRFGHWGGEITDSKVVNEAELKWLVARAVQVNDKSDAHAAYEARARLLQAQVDKCTSALEAEWGSKFRRVKLRAVLYLVAMALLAVVAGAGMWKMLHSTGRRQRDLEGQLAAASGQAAALAKEMAALQLYKVSLELDIGRRLQTAEQTLSCEAGGQAGNCTNLGAARAAAAAASAAGADGEPVMPGHDRQKKAAPGSGSSSSGHRGQQQAATQRVKAAVGGSNSDRQASGAKAKRRNAGVAARAGSAKRQRRQAAGKDSMPPEAGVGRRLFAGLATDQAQLLPEALQEALLRSHEPGTYGFGQPGNMERWGGAGVPAKAPDPWAFIHYVSNQYALHLQEWMKVQLGQAVRSQVNEMLSGSNGNSTRNSSKSGDGKRGAEQGADDVPQAEDDNDSFQQDGYDEEAGYAYEYD